MESVILPLIIPVFIAGIITFIAPCTLPLVPAFLGFISGISLKDLKNKDKIKKYKSKVFLNSIMFVFGFTIIFVIFGSLVGFLGKSLINYKIWLSRIGGFVILIFGLYMLNIINLPIFKGRGFRVIKIFKNHNLINSLFLGSAFGFGWSPCVGPILGSVLTLASSSETVLQGAFLLLVFSAGLALPFLITALFWEKSSYYIKKNQKVFNVISFIGGIFFIFLGVLLITGNFLGWIQLAYEIFKFINYEKILNYL